MQKDDIFVVSAVRTPIGTFGGSLRNVSLSSLATTAVKAAVQRSGVPIESVEHVVMGNVIPTEPRDAYLSRIAAIDSGIPKEVPAFNVNRLCGSGLQAILSAAHTIAMGDAQVAVGGGAESMSSGPYVLPSARWGSRMGDVQAIDYMTGILHDPWGRFHMGVTAENVAARYGVSRDDQDDLAFESQQRAARAIENGRFTDQIVSVEIPGKRESTLFDTDEHVRGDVTREQLSNMRAVFKEGGCVTAGNSSGINDGASAVVLASGWAVKEFNLTPLGRLVSHAHAGVDPAYMGIGPVPASTKAMNKAGLRVSDLDVVESNEAFAAQACAVMRELDLDPAKVNINGSGISLGHPVGATGSIITTKALHELARTGGRYALVTMCIGGGQGIAAIFERI